MAGECGVRVRLHEARLQYFRTALNNDDLQMARMVADTMKAGKEAAAFDATNEAVSSRKRTIFGGDDAVAPTAGAAETSRLNLAELESELSEAWAKRRRQHKILGYAAVAMVAADHRRDHPADRLADDEGSCRAGPGRAAGLVHARHAQGPEGLAGPAPGRRGPARASPNPQLQREGLHAAGFLGLSVTVGGRPCG